MSCQKDNPLPHHPTIVRSWNIDIFSLFKKKNCFKKNRNIYIYSYLLFDAEPKKKCCEAPRPLFRYLAPLRVWRKSETSFLISALPRTHPYKFPHTQTYTSLNWSHNWLAISLNISNTIRTYGPHFGYVIQLAETHAWMSCSSRSDIPMRSSISQLWLSIWS